MQVDLGVFASVSVSCVLPSAYRFIFMRIKLIFIGKVLSINPSINQSVIFLFLNVHFSPHSRRTLARYGLENPFDACRFVVLVGKGYGGKG